MRTDPTSPLRRLVAPITLAGLAAALAFACRADVATEGPRPESRGELIRTLPPLPPRTFARESSEQREIRTAVHNALRAGDRPAALAALDALSRSEPMSELKATGQVHRAHLLLQAGRPDDAIDVLLQLRQVAPPFDEAEVLLGHLFETMGRLAEAEDAWRRAIRIQPDALDTHVRLVALLRRESRDADAEAAMIGLDRAIHRVAWRIDTETDNDLRLAAIEHAAAGVPSQRLTLSLARLLALGDDATALAAARALVRVGTRDALSALRAVATSSPARETADAAIAEIERRDPPPARR